MEDPLGVTTLESDTLGPATATLEPATLETVPAKLTHCRFCATQKFYSEILDLESDLTTFREYEEIIRLLNIDFIDLSKKCLLPKSTCETCYNNLQDIYKFFTKLKKSNETELNPLEIKKEMFDDKLTKNIENKFCEASTSTQSIENIINEQTSPKCTFCLTSTDLTNQINLQNENRKEEIENIFNFFVTPYTINQTDMSCKACYNTLKMAYNFILNVKTCQKTLREYYKTDSAVAPSVRVKTEMRNINTELQTTVDENVDRSWTGYVYICCHCQYVFKCLNTLRSHSKDVHSKCNALKCADCGAQFSSFNIFVEHARGHRNELRLYCQYCNQSFNTIPECEYHVNTHYQSTSKICERCGEVLPYANTLEWHKKLYGRTGTARDPTSWEDYEWCCQECNTKFSFVSELRYHTQIVHSRCFSMKCMDCDAILKDYKGFINHASSHRPHLKQFCQYCNEYFEDTNELSKHILQHITSQQRPCTACGQIFNNNLELAEHKEFYSKKQTRKQQEKKTVKKQKEPVLVKQEPKKPRRRRRKTPVVLSVEELTCKICGKLCDDYPKYQRHLKTHDPDRPRDHVCKVCKKAFLTNGTLVSHMMTHSAKSVVCQICGWKFHTKHRLKHHLVTHTESKPFVCDECGNCFKTKRRLKCHLRSHSDVKPYKCMYCMKEFRFVQCMKTHEFQHTGVRPYSCEVCDRTFTNWTNCNKHMIRRHGVTLAKTKITPLGRLTINRKTGEAKSIANDEKAKEWLNQMLKPQKPGKRNVTQVLDTSE